MSSRDQILSILLKKKGRREKKELSIRIEIKNSSVEIDTYLTIFFFSMEESQFFIPFQLIERARSNYLDTILREGSSLQSYRLQILSTTQNNRRRMRPRGCIQACKSIKSVGKTRYYTVINCFNLFELLQRLSTER